MSVIAFLMFTDVDFLLLYPIIHFKLIYVVESNGKPHANPIKKFELKPTLIIVKLEPCDIAFNRPLCFCF